MEVEYPAIGHWFKRADGILFEVVAVDQDNGLIEIQQFDGTIGEIEAETWQQIKPAEVAAPEDWSGSVDMDPEDFPNDALPEKPHPDFDPLSRIDKL